MRTVNINAHHQIIVLLPYFFAICCFINYSLILFLISKPGKSKLIKAWDIAFIYFLTYIILLNIFFKLILRDLLFILGFQKYFSEILITELDWFVFIFINCLFNFHKVFIISILFRSLVLASVKLLGIVGINGSYIYIAIFIFIILAFILSKNKLRFISNFFLLITVWNCLEFLGSTLIEYGWNIGDSLLKAVNIDKANCSGGENPGGLNTPGGPNPQGGSPNPQGGGPNPQGDGLLAGGVETSKNIKTEEGKWSKKGSSTGYNYGSDSGLSSDDFSEYDSDDNCYHRGIEKDGFIKKSHKIFYEAIIGRIESIKLAKQHDPEHSVQITGLRPQANAMDSPILKSLQIHDSVWHKAISHLNENVLEEGFIKFKPADNTTDMEGKRLIGQALLEKKGAALYVDIDGKLRSLTNLQLNTVIKKPWQGNAFSSSWPPNIPK